MCQNPISVPGAGRVGNPSDPEGAGGQVHRNGCNPGPEHPGRGGTSHEWAEETGSEMSDASEVSTDRPPLCF